MEPNHESTVEKIIISDYCDKHRDLKREYRGILKKYPLGCNARDSIPDEVKAAMRSSYDIDSIHPFNITERVEALEDKLDSNQQKVRIPLYILL